MKTITLFAFLICLSYKIFSQSADYVTITVYRDKDVYTNNTIAKLFVNDTLRIGIKGGRFDTLKIKQGCYILRTNRNRYQYNICFNENKNYFLKIEYKNLFLFGKFNLLEITENFAFDEIKEKKMKQESYKK